MGEELGIPGPDQRLVRRSLLAPPSGGTKLGPACRWLTSFTRELSTEYSTALSRGLDRASTSSCPGSGVSGVQWVPTRTLRNCSALTWGPALGLPPVLSNHNTYYLWSQSVLAQHEAAGPAATSTIWISVGIAPERLQQWFERVDPVGAFECADCTDWRRHRPILIARMPRAPLLQFWPELKHFE